MLMSLLPQIVRFRGQNLSQTSWKGDLNGSLCLFWLSVMPLRLTRVVACIRELFLSGVPLCG